MKNEAWGAHFRLTRQLDQSELARYADYAEWCRAVIECEPANEEIWRIENQKIRTV